MFVSLGNSDKRALRRRIASLMTKSSRLIVPPGEATVSFSVPATLRNYQNTLRRLSVVLCAVVSVICMATTTVNAGTVAGAVTGQPNNDDFSGSFDANPNSHSLGGGRLSSLELVVPVVDSGGTTEYAFTISGSYSGDKDPPLTLDYRLQLGFGTGDAFVPAGQIAEELDFDTPLPTSPEPIIAVFGGVDQHLAGTLELSGASPAWTIDSFFLPRIFKLSVDVPDLPASVMDFYDAADLPPNFPVGGRAFTLRGSFVPEPQACWIGLAGLLGFVVLVRAR